MKIAACRKLVGERERGTWYRALAPLHAQDPNDPLGYAHTLKVRSRFSTGRFEVLHFSESRRLTLWEFGAVYGSVRDDVEIENETLDVTIINVAVDLQKVADLTSEATQGRLQTNIQELTGDWQSFETRFAPTQELGEALFSSGFEGIRAFSAKVCDQKNLLVFPRNLMNGSSLTYRSRNGKVYRLPKEK